MKELKLDHNLNLERCPHCKIAMPHLNLIHNYPSWIKGKQQVNRTWRFYNCNSCGAVVSAYSLGDPGIVEDYFPKTEMFSESIPEKPRELLKQAIDSLQSPAASIMGCAASIDSMLKDKGYKEGKLYVRIEQAAKDHLITKEMAKWAHQIRIEANDQRHADENAPLPDQIDAQRIIDFTKALAQFLYVIPAMVDKGIQESTDKPVI